MTINIHFCYYEMFKIYLSNRLEGIFIEYNCIIYILQQYIIDVNKIKTNTLWLNCN